MASMTDFDNISEALARMSEAQIRRNQDLVAQQISMAYEQKNTDALMWLQRAADEYANEMMRRLVAAQ
jgi:hypothetical protein